MARVSMREEIVDAALEQFHAHGFNAAGVKDITDRAGVPKGSFYNHFDSKESLAALVLQRYGAARQLAGFGGEAVAPLLRLRRHFEFLRDETVQAGFARGCMFGNFGAEIGDHNEALRGVVAESLRQWAASIAAVIIEAQGAGQVRAALDPPSIARFVLNAWEGTLIQVRSERSTAGFDAFFGTVFDVLLAP